MSDYLRHCLNQQIISPLSYFFAQFIAQHSEQPIDSLLCLTAALVSQRNQDGDICINLNEYAHKIAFDLDTLDEEHKIKYPHVEQWIQEISAFSCVSSSFDQQPIIIDGQSVYLGKLWHFEHAIVEQIKKRVDIKPMINEALLEKGLHQLFDSKSQAIDWQKIAASMAVTQSFCVISGGPGTGKTSTLIKVLALLIEQQPNINIQLCAPTGKAAIRMLEAINSRKEALNLNPLIINQMPQTAKTIHRLLAYQQGIFRVNQQSPLQVDCLVIDEASMIDLELMHHLLSALSDTCRLILLGDKDQLSSVDAGHVFSDICGRWQTITFSNDYASQLAQLNKVSFESLDSAEKAPSIANAIAMLKTSFRFTDDSEIGQLAKLVNTGQGDAALRLIQQSQSELNLMPVINNELPKQLIDIALTHYAKVVEAKTIEQAIKAFEKFQLLCAVHKGPLGVEALNELISYRLLLRHKMGAVQQFNGQPIMMTQNDYENHLFNGDIGLLWQTDQQFSAYFLQHDGSLKSYPLIGLTHYQTAWAMTVHKSQGSEYDDVLLVLPSQSSARLNRELIYTGITRAKSKFYLCSEPSVFVSSCLQKTLRTSNLSTKLGWKQSD